VPTDFPAAPQRAEPTGFRVTGRFVLVAMIAFFGVIFSANLIMARFAVSTFGGVETESSYKAGLAFKAEEEAAKAQADRNWAVDAAVKAVSPGVTRVEISPRNAAGAPQAGLTLALQLLHPTDARLDHIIAVEETAPGVYSGTTEAAPGQWELRLAFSKEGERLFRSTSRVILR
jgi:nitrogen fixation protein FixH